MDQAFRMLRLGRQGGVKGKKLPPLVLGDDFRQARPIGHLAAHPGGLAFGLIASLLLRGGQGLA